MEFYFGLNKNNWSLKEVKKKNSQREKISKLEWNLNSQTAQITRAIDLYITNKPERHSGREIGIHGGIQLFVLNSDRRRSICPAFAFTTRPKSLSTPLDSDLPAELFDFLNSGINKVLYR